MMYRTELDKALAPLVDRLWHREPRNGWDHHSVVDCLTWDDVKQVAIDADDAFMIEDAMGHLTTLQLVAVIDGLYAPLQFYHEAIKTLAVYLLPLLVDRCEAEESERVRNLPAATQAQIAARNRP